MTRIFTDGAEMGDTLFFSYAHPSYVTATATSPASGSYCYAMYAAEGLGYKTITSASECYVRTRVKLESATVFTQDPPYFPALYSDNTAILWLTMDGASHFRVATPDGALATATSLFYADVWYMLEMYATINDTSGSVIVKQNGIEIMNFSGDTKYSSYTSFNRVGWRGSHGALFNENNSIYIDDIALNDANGSEDNSWCGGGHVELLIPASDGDTLEWTPSSGSVHYEMVDEIPADGDATYVSASAAKVDMYYLSPFSGSGKGPIGRVWVTARARDASYNGGNFRVGIKTSSGSILMSDWQPLGGLYDTNIQSSASPLNPDDDAAWEVADINGLQVVIESE